MPLPSGRNLALSRPRRLMCDLMHVSKCVPAVMADRRMDLGPVVRARRWLEPRPCWYAVLVKAYALLCRERAELRRVYRSFPWPHLHEHSIPVAEVPISRVADGEEGVLFMNLRKPDEMGIDELHARIEHGRTAPLDQIGSFRTQLRLTCLPWPLRRAIWWLALNGPADWRLRYLGTFGITGVAGGGSDTTSFLSPLTTSLTFGVIGPDGQTSVRLLYDHRVLDGELVGRCLCRLEEILLDQIVCELIDLAGVTRPRLAA
jgi:hypothetical protein